MAKKVSVVEHEKEAVYKVYFCDRENKQKKTRTYCRCQTG